MSDGPGAFIMGAGGHAVSVAETVIAAGNTLKGFVGNAEEGDSLLNLPILSELPHDHLGDGGIVIVAIGDNSTRERVWRNLAERVPVAQLPAIVHPSASVSRFARLSAGCVVMQGAVIAAGARLGTGCLVNSAATLEHECSMEDFSSLAPGVAVGGRVTIGARSAISIGAVVKHGITIGSDVIIGAASYLNADMSDGVVAYGTPARIVRTRDANDPYLG